MPTLLRPDERRRQLRWLSHGVELAQDFYGAKACHSPVILRLLTEALDTFDQVPDQERRWLSSGTRSGGWNGVGLTAHELAEIERLRVLSAMSPFEEGGRAPPQRDAVERAYDVLTWLRWTHKGDDHRLSKAALLMARGKPEAAAHAFRPGRAITKVAYEVKAQTVGRILRGLREEAGIIPSPDGVRFQELYHAAQ